MSRFLLSGMLFLACSSAVLANDLKPGLWEITSSMEGEGIPKQLTREQSSQECLTAEDGSDMVATMRKRWNETGCQDMDISRDGDKIEVAASCEAGGRTTDVDALITVHSNEHYSSEVTTTNDSSVTTYREASWVSSECEE
ncbi:DUF3617 domain-containing protein [Idiomarina sp.]|uniref:DUF3617 domain-containing protein n=1 Tax=Idiomarina sp. TaxID=1874361 RepID=UPI003A94F67C